MLLMYKNTCFGHVMSKVCQYATNGDKVSIGLTLVNVKNSQIGLQKSITWTKKSTSINFVLCNQGNND
jgi:hypothetical protein